MKRISAVLFVIGLLLASCGGGKLNVSLEEAPDYKDGVAYPIVISLSEGDDAVTGADVSATLEMAKMDHGIIEVVFADRGDGTYEGEVALPMAGEWTANIVALTDEKTAEDIVTFEVKEG